MMTWIVCGTALCLQGTDIKIERNYHNDRMEFVSLFVVKSEAAGRTVPFWSLEGAKLGGERYAAEDAEFKGKKP